MQWRHFENINPRPTQRLQLAYTQKIISVGSKELIMGLGGLAFNEEILKVKNLTGAPF